MRERKASSFPKLQRDCHNSLTLPNAGELSCGWIPKKNVQVQEQKKRFIFVCLRSRKKREIRKFRVVAKKYTKKWAEREKL